MTATKLDTDRLRKRAGHRGLRIIKRGATFQLHDGVAVVCTGTERDIEQYLDAHPAAGRNHPLYTLPPEWQRAVDGWREWLRIGGLSPNTVRLRYDHVRMIARRSNTQRPQDITLGDLVRLSSGQTWSREHRKGMRRSLVSFFDWCISNAIVDTNPATGLPSVRGDTPRPRPATDDVWQDLINSAPPRELLMIRLAGEAGLRRGEVALCHRNDLIEDPRGPSLIVHGKGRKQRVVPITDSLAGAIREYCASGFIFPGRIDGHISLGHIGTQISRMMPPGYTMHTLRHLFASRAYRGSRNLRAVQMLLGHASVATTERYCAVDDFEIRAAMESASAGVGA
jgi:integrase